MGARELALVLASAALHAAWNVAAKRQDRPTTFLFGLLAATFVGALLVLPFMPLAQLTGSIALVLLASAVCHGLSFIVLARAYESGALSVVYPISRSTPALVPLFAVPWLGERLSLIGACGVALTVIGMWLVQTGGDLRSSAFRQRGTLWAYLLLLLTTGFSILDKRLMVMLAELPWGSPVPRAVVAYLLPAAGAALLLAPVALRGSAGQATRALLKRQPLTVVLAALATFASYALALEALRTAQVSYVVAVRQCSVLFAVALSVWALRERPTPGRWLGTLGTVAGVALIAMYA